MPHHFGLTEKRIELDFYIEEKKLIKAAKPKRKTKNVKNVFALQESQSQAVSLV